MARSYNKAPKDGKGWPEFAVKNFPALFSCNDQDYQRRLSDFMDGKMTLRDRRALRAEWGLDAKHR